MLRRRFATMMTKQASSQLNIHSTVKLASGYEMPRLGLGFYQVPISECANIIKTALSYGYRHIDTATAYRNESACAAAMVSPFPEPKSANCNTTLPRSALFYTTKLPPRLRGYDATYTSINTTLSNTPELEGYIDLYLIHAPYGGKENRLGEWRAMRDAVKEGKIRSIGVSNYSIAHMEELHEWIKFEEEQYGQGAGGVVSVGQWEVHPWLPRHDILDYCKKHNIAVQAYSPLVRGMKFGKPGERPKGTEYLYELAQKYNKTPAQVLLRWSLQMGCTPLPKSVNLERVKENIDVFGWELEEEEVRGLDTGGYEPCAWDPSRDCKD